MRIDLHSHSSHSPDGWLSPADLVEVAVSAGLDMVAITDHREISGAIAAHEEHPDRVIIGEEIHCKGGTHIIGLFLNELVPSDQSVSDTVRAVRAQGGLIYAPHPFAYMWNPASHARLALDEADIVEVFNSRAFLPGWNRKAAEAAIQRAIPQAASSDAHFPWEFGRAFTELPEFSGVEEFRQAIRRAVPVGNKVGSPWLHVASRMIAEVRRFGPSPRESSVLPTPSRHQVGDRPQ